MQERNVVRDLLGEIKSKVRGRSYRLTSHAEAEREADQITIAQLEEVLVSPASEVLEDYAQDPRGHSCLVLGLTGAGQPVHVLLLSDYVR